MTCPICKKPASIRYRPFCSARCADVDLAHWLRGDYSIPADGDETAFDDEGKSGAGNFAVDSREQGG